MGMLRCLVFNEQDGIEKWRETVVDLRRVQLFQEDNENDGSICLVVSRDLKEGIRANITMKRMMEIMKEHKQDPDKDFDESGRETLEEVRKVSPPVLKSPAPTSQPYSHQAHLDAIEAIENETDQSRKRLLLRRYEAQYGPMSNAMKGAVGIRGY